MAFIEPMHRNKPNITYLLTYEVLCMICSRKFKMVPLTKNMGQLEKSN